MSRRLLLDTRPLLWWLAGEPIDGEAGAAIADSANVVLVSAASVWEIAIKRSIGKLRFAGSPVDEIDRAGFGALAIAPAHAEIAGDLPLHHRDPIDRMLVAQSIAEGLTLVSRDAALERYGVEILRC